MKRLITISLFLLLAFGLKAQTLYKVAPYYADMDKDHLELIDGIVNNEIKNKTIPGAVVAVVRDNMLVYLKAFGNKSVEPKVEQMTTNTIFDLASVSKSVSTTICILQLVENGQLRLTDPVKRYFPDFKPWEDPDTGKKVDITVRDLLTHCSGLDPYINVDEYVKEYGENSPKQLMTYISTKVKRNFRPGTDFIYSCLNFITLQNILEQITGERLCDYAENHIFKPLGMRNTFYFPLDRKVDSKIAKRCAPTEVQADGKPLIAKVHDPLARRINWGNSGNAGVFSTAEDLAKLSMVLMNKGRYSAGLFNYNYLLSPFTIKMMTQIPSYMDPKIGRTLGWDKLSDYSGFMGDIFDRTAVIGHTGYTGTSIMMDMDSKVAIIILTNRVHPHDKGSVTRLRAQIANIVASSITPVSDSTNIYKVNYKMINNVIN